MLEWVIEESGEREDALMGSRCEIVRVGVVESARKLLNIWTLGTRLYV